VADDDDLYTDTFSNARGWTAVRVTHKPSGLVAERQRSAVLKSAVEAQRECIAEIKGQLAVGQPPQATVADPPAAPDRSDAPVTRSEFEALVDRVSRLERRKRAT
jgi:hypothetical protein